MNQLTSLLLICAGIVLLLSTLTGSHGLLHLQKINNEQRFLEQKNQELEEEVQELQAQIAAVQHQPFTLEKKARQELGLSRPGEIVYIFPGNEP